MRKLASVFLSVLLMLSMSACGSQNAPTQPTENQIRNEGTISSEITDSEIVDTTDTASDSESADDTEEPETTPNTGESNSSSGINTGSDMGRSAAENRPVGTTKPEETNLPVPVIPPVAQPSDTDPKPVPTPKPPQGKTLIVYFSWSSNTERMANTIKEQTDGDILKLIPVTAYPTDYTDCTEVALAERDNNARPAIQNMPASIDEYDTILIGFPIWWHTAPMIIGTFLESYNLTGIDVYPFTQSASMDRTQFNNSMEFVRECADGATVHDGLFARYSDTSSITTYLKNNNLIK